VTEPTVEKSSLDQLRIERAPEKQPRKWVRYVLVAIVLAVLAGAGFYGFRVLPVADVYTTTAKGFNASSAATVLNASGYVTARRQATVSSKFTGKVTEVLIEEGMRVEQGQVLARLVCV
jgi:multidrug efflux pump subunit AcrA (membrane-fusion protein)